jgi:hypothetical protein
MMQRKLEKDPKDGLFKKKKIWEKIMKKNKMASWTDTLMAESTMPDDAMTFTDGSNYLMDGFSFDTPPNEGVLQGARLPETKGLAKLPDGIVTAEMLKEDEISFEEIVGDEKGPDYEEMLSEEEGAIPKDASLQDLAWLDPLQAQDPSRLPHNHNDSMPDIEAAWGQEQQTTGLTLVPNKDKETAEYVQFIKMGPKSGLPGNHSKNAKILDALCKASRMSHFGHSMDEIKRVFIDTLGQDALIGKKAFDRIEAEHGLAGKVFIRASVFPGLKKGKWVTELRKKAVSASYVITDDQVIANKLGMEMVEEVPWVEAYESYAPRLKAAGYSVSRKGDLQKALKVAFLSEPVIQKPQETPKPVVKPVVATEQQVQEELERVASEPKTEIKTAEEIVKEAKLKKAKVAVAKLVKDGRISQADAIRIVESTDNPYRILEAASHLVTATKDQAIYDGTGAHLPKEAQNDREKVGESLEVREAAFEQGQFKKAQDYLAQTVKRGLLTIKEAKRIASTAKSAKDLMGLTTTAIKAAEMLRKAEVEVSAPPKDYAGPVVKAAAMQRVSEPTLTPEMKRIAAIAERTGIKSGEFVSMLRWARQQMSEGLAGKDLNTMLLARFSEPLLKAASELLVNVRKAHEGLSGFVYVDAEAYDSPRGITGCERGALKHRANALKYVLEMPKCTTCVHKNANGICQQYNKRLANEVPVENPKEFQKKAIQLANASDAEVTANLFNPQEFNLHNASLEEIGFEEQKTATPIDKILFGGLEIETK